MGVTGRVVVLMSPEERQSLDRKVARHGKISAGELVRRAADAYDEDALREAAELREMIDLLEISHRGTLDQLDAPERKLDETIAYLQTSNRRPE